MQEDIMVGFGKTSEAAVEGRSACALDQGTGVMR